MPVIKWYLNLENAYGGTTKGRAGLAIGLVATRTSGPPGPGGRAVDWTLVEAGPHDSDRDYVPNPAAFAAARTLEQGGVFRNTLNITQIGGRTYTVTATKTGDANSVAFNQQYQSWRRIYYSVHHMNSACKALFESVEQQIKDIFAGVFIELKRRSIRSCIVNEAVTDAYGPGGLTLTHTYGATSPRLDRAPHHLRVVIVRDVVKSIPFAVHWTMDSTTATGAGKLIRVSSEGPHNREVVYNNDLAVINALDPAQSLTVSVHAAAVAIPDPCIARTGTHRLRVNLSADPTTAPIRTALLADKKATLTATLMGRRCTAGFAAGTEHVVQATLTSANVESNPVVVGTTKIWIEDRGASVLVEDPRILLASPRAGDELRLTLSNAVVIDVHPGRVHRVNEHKLWLNCGGEAQFLHDIALRPIQISLRLHGLRANGPIEAQADHEFDLREFTRNTNTTRRKVAIQVDADGRMVDVEASWLALATNNPLAMRIETLDVPIAIPLAALTVPLPQKLKINLNADDTLQPAAQAMAAGGKLTFDGKLKGIHSLGGYSPPDDRSFIALTTRKVRADETEDTIKRRLMLVFCHELGHALQLSFPWVQNHGQNRRENNDRRYQDAYGGTGPHCNHNAHLEPSGADRGHESTSSGEIYVSTVANSLCIMYHTMDLAHMNDDFCDRCKAHLRRKTVSF